MKNLKDVCRYLDELLHIHEIPDESLNGLQVEGGANISRIAFMVNFCQEGAERACKEGADLIVCHHGLIWGGLKEITGIVYSRLKVIMDRGTSLYAAHLPMDVHPEFGHGALFLKALKIDVKGKFGQYGPMKVGVWGDLNKSESIESVIERIEHVLKMPCRELLFGKNKVQRIGVVSGSGVSALEEAVDEGVDLFITGESKLAAFDLAKELGINVVFGGHYATETFGLKALMERVKSDLGLEVLFIDIPTEL
ncbi:MAG: Nif3-like dinuclear metal center hexameric protein [Candidatus Theseobacter exili]|nr:Nif3-like dinuclear metal center hexameric protein [Candidatus Theseobacter exili]